MPKTKSPSRKSAHTAKKQPVANKRPAAQPKTAVEPIRPALPDRPKPARHRTLFRRGDKPDVFARSHALPSVWRLARSAALVLAKNWKLFGSMTLLYTLFSIFLVRGFAALADTSSLEAVLQSGMGPFSAGLSNFLVLVSQSGEYGSTTGSLYQAILFLVFSLAVVWALRHVIAGSDVGVRDAFYKGMYPLVPVLIVLFVICLQLLPLIAASSIFSFVIVSGVAASLLEYIVWGLLCLLIASISIFWLTSSIFALYIAALPDMTPLKALRSARGLVRYRRWTVLRKNLFLPIALAVIAMVIIIPFILFLTPAAPWIFFILSMVALPLIHTYLYTLYRELLI